MRWRVYILTVAAAIGLLTTQTRPQETSTPAEGAAGDDVHSYQVLYTDKDSYATPLDLFVEEDEDSPGRSGKFPNNLVYVSDPSMLCDQAIAI